MASDWDVYPIGDFVTLSQGLAINAKSKYLLEEKGLPLLRITDLINGTQVHFVNEEKVPVKCIATDHELIYTRTGQVGLVYRNKVGVVHNNCFKVIPSSELDKDFLYWFLFQESTKAHVNAVASGSVQKDLNHAAFLTLEIPKPSLPQQKAIAYILDSLDDKIEINCQMNETLEAMAQALFKSWFVDFDPVIDNALAAGKSIPDELLERAEQRKAVLNSSKTNQAIRDLFPDEFEFTEEMSWIPKGWDSVTLGNFAIFSNGKTSPEREVGSIPVFGSNGEIGVCKNSNRNNVIIIGRVGTYCGSLYYYSGECWITDNAMSAEMHNKDNNLFLLQLLSRANLNDRRTGSGQPLLNQSILRSVKTILPSDLLINEYSRIANDLYQKINKLNESNRILSNLRDTLLPKLLSGELRIPEAERLIDEAL